MWDSFHGASLDAVSVGGDAMFRNGIGPLLPGCEHTPPPDPRHCPFHCGAACNLRCADYIEYVLAKEGDVAAVPCAAMERMRDLQRRHPLVGDVRGIGLLLGIELVRDRKTMERACDEAEKVMDRA